MHPLLKPEFGLLIWTLVAFLIVFFILKKFAWPAIIKGLNGARSEGFRPSAGSAPTARREPRRCGRRR